ncbi:ABC transporter ATP-binding protein [Xanthobacter dioxanivorans]|uniref:ABC transporter ATP-binding protein n=1 Tax=Xanthobacter dioxanivorans TaxID=2528964 RepID=A0A974PJX4_9HYPH|nr:ABC transporter ATP-binding protein [Xanthobacter dioxanivorans]QRG04889.1 ABC transporter ATP-binding protein [Xanthobacter dioxanivorans]
MALHAVAPAPAAPSPVAAAREAHIEISSLTKTYKSKGGHVPSLRPIDLTIARGEFVAIVGPSGCGKSTLLKLVAGLLPATSGAIAIGGKTVKEPLDDVGIVFQSPVLLPWRNVRDNILLQVEMRGRDKAAYRAAAARLLKTAGLDGFEERFPWELSGGMQQRAAICRALVHDPSVLLMDEPFGALDAMTRERMNAELQRIWIETRKTVLLITHSIPEAVYLADRVVVMSNRPGAIEAIYDIDLPRPRELSIMGESQFVRFTQDIRKHFFAEGNLDH